jgi:hypothetical protein
MKHLALVVLFTTLMAYGEKPQPKTDAHEGKSAGATQQTDGANGGTIPVVNQQAPEGQQENHPSKPPSYLSRFFSPENLPADALVIVGAVGIFVALKTLREMKKQRIEMAGQRGVMAGQLVQMQGAGEQTERIIQNAVKQVGLMEAAREHTEKLASQAVRQSDITQRQFDLANRPWVCLDSIVVVSDFTFNDSGEAVIFFQYQIRNVGHSVAQHLKPWIEPIVSGVHNPLEVKERISALQRKPVDSVFDHGKLIFPSQIIVDNYPVVIRKEIVEAAIKDSPFKVGDKHLPCFGVELFICFDYQSTLDPTIHHQTQSMYVLGYAEPSGAINGAFYPSRGTYRNTIMSANYKGYGAYAD